MTAFPMPAEDSEGVTSPLEDVASPPALLRLPKYYQVKKQLLDFTAAMAPGSPVPPERELARHYGTSRTTVRQALADLVIEGVVDRYRSVHFNRQPAGLGKVSVTHVVLRSGAVRPPEFAWPPLA